MMKKIGILGGGQLGKMFLQSAYNYPNDCFFLDVMGSPCERMTDYFIQGDIKNYDDVMAFGQSVDVIGIEIEHVNVDALLCLEKQGKTVIPSPKTLQIIQDKGLQKAFYKSYQINTPNYFLITDKSYFLADYSKLLSKHNMSFPIVQKLRTGGYDGQGVQIIKSENEINQLWDEPSVIESFTQIKKEIAVIVIKDKKNECISYSPVEMHFDEKLNLVDYLFAPSTLSEKETIKATVLAEKVAMSFKGQGIFAVEMFLDDCDELWVNEVAPRVHNSGHHTIEAARCSQFEQMFRLLADYPIASTELLHASAMINLIGEPNEMGDAKISGIERILLEKNCYLHWYGKSQTKPGRKMGHITILGNPNELESILAVIKEHVKVVSNSYKNDILVRE